jgi:hypothetical protein
MPEMYAYVGPDWERCPARKVSVHRITADHIGTHSSGLLHIEPTDARVLNRQGQVVVSICDLRLYLSDTTTARRLAEWLTAAADAIDSRGENA